LKKGLRGKPSAEGVDIEAVEKEMKKRIPKKAWITRKHKELKFNSIQPKSIWFFFVYIER